MGGGRRDGGKEGRKEEENHRHAWGSHHVGGIAGGEPIWIQYQKWEGEEEEEEEEEKRHGGSPVLAPAHADARVF